MFKYFNKCFTAEDVKATFKDLAKKLHPDNGGNAEDFKNMMAEYTDAWKMYKNIHKTAEGETYENTNEETAATDEEGKQYSELIMACMNFDNVVVEIIGSWIWLSGNTKMYSAEIKDLGFFWSKNKKAWYYNGSKKKSKRRGRYSMEQLRNMWDTEEVKAQRARLA